jgi:hypothetical protein
MAGFLFKLETPKGEPGADRYPDAAMSKWREYRDTLGGLLWFLLITVGAAILMVGAAALIYLFT